MGQGQGAVGLEERRQQAQASRRNQRLAAQMERRPAVVAALKLKKKVGDLSCMLWIVFCHIPSYLYVRTCEQEVGWSLSCLCCE